MKILLGGFDHEADLLAAVHAARSRGVPVREVFTPYYVHGLDEALGDPRSRLPWITLAGGLAGLLGAIGLQVWAAVIDWPLNVGGKPTNSALAFLPITFEATILLGGLATAGAFFWRSGLRPSLDPPQRLTLRSTDDTLVLALSIDGLDEEAVRALLRDAGAREVREETA
jgi:hypothetical protein